MTQPQYGYAPQQQAQQGYAPQPGGYQTYDPNQQYQQAPPAPQGYAAYPPPQYGPPPQGYAPGYYPPGQPPVPQQPPLANGTLEDFFAQPTIGGGKGISWKGVPDGFTVWGMVSRPIGNGDVFQDTDPMTKAPRFFRDGQPKLSMQVPLKLLVPLPGYNDGEARLFLRGQLRDETTRAMQEAGAPEGPPEAGAFMAVTLTHRKPGNNIAQNMFAVVYRSPGTWENDPNLLQQQIHATAQAPVSPYNDGVPAGYPGAPQFAQAPVQGVQGYGAPQQVPYQQPAQYGPGQPQQQYAAAQGQPMQAAPNPQQYAPQQYGQQAYDPNQNGQPQTAPQYGQAPAGAASAGDQAAYSNTQAQQGYQAAVPGPAPTQQQYQDPNQVQGQQQLPIPPQPPAAPVQPGLQQSALPPEKQALLARMQGQQPQAQQAQQAQQQQQGPQG